MTYYYTYKITCLKGSLKDHYYFGQHHTENLDDGYIGSGRKIRDYFKKYPEKEGYSYTKEIIAFYNNKDELNEAEFILIGDKYQTDPLCLNLKAGGGQAGYSDETRKLISGKAIGRPSSFKGKHQPERAKQILSEKHKALPKKCWVYKDYVEYLIYESELDDYISNGYIKGRLISIWGVNKTKKPDSEETRYKKGVARDKRWINNGIIQTYVSKAELNNYLENGWVLGYVKTNKNNDNKKCHKTL